MINTQKCSNKIAIIIVSYNSKHLMRNCIDSIRKNADCDYKIVVVDNASTDGVIEYLEAQEDIILIKNSENNGFAKACNQGVKAINDTQYKDADLFFLNNDTRICQGTIRNLQKALYSSEDFGAAGAVSNYAGNNQQLNIIFDTVDDYIDYGQQLNNVENPIYEERVRLSGFALLVKNNIFKQAGGFDEDFTPGYFEDDALSMQILKLSYRLICVGSAFVYHAGSQSFIQNSDTNDILIRHQNLFYKKYGFDILKYSDYNEALLKYISYDSDSSFNFLELGSGLGADLKMIRSVFKNAKVYGIERNPYLRDIASKTEIIYESLEELFINEKGVSFDILVYDSESEDFSLTQSEYNIIDQICNTNCITINAPSSYKNFDFEKIKMVIWDLDDTFWHGTLSEGDIDFVETNIELVRTLTNCGIINSISSKNNEKDVLEKLSEAGIADLFVFNDINWNNKGAQIQSKIKNMGLRAGNVLFIDDNPHNLEEAKSYEKDLMTALPDFIPYIDVYYANAIQVDPDHDRLKKYKLLESKRLAEKVSTSKEDFLRESNIEVTICRNCLDEIERISELVSRTNQLNYTKNRDDKKLLKSLILNDWNENAYIRVKDRFGDYGIVGFYCYNRREKHLEHFLFSCRIIGMGIEQYIYNAIGCPEFTIKEPVVIPLLHNKKVDWIHENDFKGDSTTNQQGQIRILFKGPCDLSGIEVYLSGGSITTEFNYVNDNGVITTGQNHSIHIRESYELSQQEIDDIITSVPFLSDGDFTTKLFESEYHIICYSLLQDLNAGLYQNKKTGRYISFSDKRTDITNPDVWDDLINGRVQNHGYKFTRKELELFSEKWKFIGAIAPTMLIENLDFIVNHVKGSPTIILLTGSEKTFGDEGPELSEMAQVYRNIKPGIIDFADRHPNVKVINPSEFIKCRDDYADNINHYSKNIQFEIAGRICEVINDKVDELSKRI